jgi:hypothetical protein
MVAPAATPQPAAQPAVPTAIAPIGAPAPAAATDAARQALEPVRQAIAARDFAGAQQALDRARQVNPNDPAIAVYENLIRNGLGQGQVNNTRSVIRTPIPGVTPLPTLAPTPSPTPEATPVSVAPAGSSDQASSSGGVAEKATDLLKNQNVLYGLYALGAVIVLLVLYAIFRKRKSSAAESSDIYEEPTPVPGTLSAVGGGGLDFSGNYDPLSGTSDSAFSPATDFSAMTDTGAGGAALGGAAMSAGAPEFTAFGFGDEDEESAPAKPAFTPRPAPTVDDDLPVSIHDDEPTAILPEAPMPVSNATPSGGVSFESLGLTPPEKPAASIPTAGSAPMGSPGTVNLDDIFGNQPLPGAGLPADDDNSQTLPTFVTSPGSERPEETVELPPRQPVPPVESEEKDLTISFDELFGSTSPSQPAVTAARAPEPAPAVPQSDQSIEDALAATLGAMQEQEPNAAPAPSAGSGASATPAGTESLDERTERMFHDQMEKARAAMAEKNWRQAVHVLSIASALHPENEEAKQMLREARTEKRKSEESV